MSELLCMSENFARSMGVALGPPCLSLRGWWIWGLQFPQGTKMDIFMHSHLDTGAFGILGT